MTRGSHVTGGEDRVPLPDRFVVGRSGILVVRALKPAAGAVAGGC